MLKDMNVDVFRAETLRARTFAEFGGRDKISLFASVVLPKRRETDRPQPLTL
jgi:hypothetical protein